MPPTTKILNSSKSAESTAEFEAESTSTREEIISGLDLGIPPIPAHKSGRLQQSLIDHDARGEKSIAIAQAGICCFVLALHLIAQYSSSWETLNLWVPCILTGLILSSIFRFMAAGAKSLPERQLEILNVTDIAIFLSLIWSYQFAYDHAASGILKAPSMTLLFALVGLRALRFHPVPILTSGTIAFVGWGMIAGMAALKSGSDSITREYTQYLTSLDILIGAEVEKMVALAALTMFLALAMYKARGLLSKAADASDYAEALDSAKRNIETAEKAKDGAEKALTALDKQERELKEQNTRFNVALDNMSQGLCMFDADKNLMVCNELYIEMYDLDPALAKPGTPFRKIIEHRIQSGIFSGDDPESYVRERLAAVEEGVASTKIQEMPNGRVIAISHQPMAEGAWVATHQDITEIQRIEAQVTHLAHHDALTDLPNRTTLRTKIEEALSRVARGEDVAVMCLDLDRFKSVNDTLGHPVGDELLKTVAKRLRSCVREADTIARLGGDEFAIIQVAGEQPKDATALAQRICDVLKRPFDIDGHRVVVGTSVGIAMAPGDGEDPDLLIKNADMALYGAKSDGRGSFRFFEPEMDARVKQRRELELDLRKGLELGQFELHYQPLQSVKTRDISGFEALLRWRHPERGLVSPLDFIPLTEEIGLIIPLGEWVIRQACADASQWPDHVKVAVNVSPVQFKNGNLVSIIMSALAGSGIEPNRLEVEITESVLLLDSEATLSTLHQLRSLGVRIAMDDFGTGYSSLSYLRSFPFDKIKIDGSFIKDLDNSDDAAAIVRAVAGLGASLGMTTTAECVETEEQMEKVAAEGYGEIQGFLFSPPRPASEVADFFPKISKLPMAAAG
jgi:diguanylate cyclase (GGDEF)-like protein